MSGDRLDKDKTNVPPKTLLQCSECLKEVPRSEAFVREGADYTLYFCGLDCFDKWLSANSGQEAGSAGAPREKERNREKK